MSAQEERLWLLKAWRTGGWRQNLRSGKKWDQHLAMLTKQGMLDEEGGMYRITDKGLSAIGGDQ